MVQNFGPRINGPLRSRWDPSGPDRLIQFSPDYQFWYFRQKLKISKNSRFEIFVDFDIYLELVSLVLVFLWVSAMKIMRWLRRRLCRAMRHVMRHVFPIPRMARKSRILNYESFIMNHLKWVTKKILILDDLPSKKGILSFLGFAAIITFAAVGWSGWNQMTEGQVHSRSFEVKRLLEAKRSFEVKSILRSF